MSPVLQEGIRFRQELCIPCYQTDSQGLLKPTSFMDMAQEIAYWAADALGFGYDSLHVHHTAWVLIRLHVHFEQPVHWRDNVSLFTWHKGTNGIYYLRDFLMHDAAGQTAVSATSSWVVMDERTRRLVRPEDMQHLMQVEQVEHAIAEPAPKLVAPKDMEQSGEHVVIPSDIDINAHTNNARYVAWAMDCLSAEASERPVTDLFVNFNKETTLGERVQLFRRCVEDGWYVEGRTEGKSCFVVKLVCSNSPQILPKEK